MKKLRIFTVLISILIVINILEGSDRPNFHNGNKLLFTFFNDGRTESQTELAAEWPIATGHEYLDLAYPFLIIGNGGSQEFVTFEAAPDFTSYTDGRVAVNNMKESWPPSWPDRSSQWNSNWNGYFGIDVLNADRESFYAMENNSLGLRLKVRGWQWSHYLAQDMIIIHYELENIGTSSYDQAAFGFFTRPAVGGDNADDDLFLNLARSQIIAVDRDNLGKGRGGPEIIGNWSPVGRFGIGVLETPSNSNDNIDNDGDGIVDESRSDGIDNDGDWQIFTDLDSSGSWDVGEPLNDDLGADGVAYTGDNGEGDGVATAGEPNFDQTDVDESDQIGLTSLATYSAKAFTSDAAVAALSPGRFDTPSGNNEFVLGAGNFSLPVGEIQRFSVVLFLSANELDQGRNEETIDRIYRDNYRFPVAPIPPQVEAVVKSNQVTLYWDTRSEEVEDFEGYKIYRSTDPGFNDVYTVTDDKGNLIYSEPQVTVDLVNGIKDFFPKESFGFRYYRGKNSGFTHWWTDDNVLNGRTYYYAIVAFDRGAVDSLTEEHEFPTESTKSLVITKQGEIITDINTLIATPTVESSGYQNPEYLIDHIEGVSTGTIQVEIINRNLLRDALYQVTFDSSGSDTAYSIQDITDPGNPITLVNQSSNYSTEEKINDADPMIDGFRVLLIDDNLAWDSLNTDWKVGDSNWSIHLALNFNLGPPVIPVPASYEVRFAEMGVDTALFTTPIPVPFEVWNITDNVKENILVLDQNGDGEWSSGEIIYIVEGNTIANFRPIYWAITLTAPSDTTIASIAPESGDIALVPTLKPFGTNDIYTISTKSARVQQSPSESTLDNIKVVPNPYIVSSRFEQSFLYTGGQTQRKLQFIHLPKRCTIRIFNLRGSRIATLEHNSTLDDGSEFWDLKAEKSGKVVAFGIYFYHIDAPGIGERIGRFGIIR